MGERKRRTRIRTRRKRAKERSKRSKKVEEGKYWKVGEETMWADGEEDG